MIFRCDKRLKKWKCHSVHSSVYFFLRWRICCKLFTTVSWVFHQCFTGVSQVFRECFTSVSRVFYKCFKSVSRVFQECFNSFSRVFQECFSRVFQKCFKRVSNMFQTCFNRVSNEFQKTCFKQACFKHVSKFLLKLSQLPEDKWALFFYFPFFSFCQKWFKISVYKMTIICFWEISMQHQYGVAC